MILNLGSLAFNANIEGGGGTPAWGTELGQGEGYRFQFEGAEEFLTSMLYTSVADIENITCPLGKGGGRADDYEFVLGSVYDKVFVNGIKIPDAKFILLVVKTIHGNYHVGRRSLKYNPRMTYHGIAYNDDCYKRIPVALGLKDNAAWFIDEIFTNNQDELHFVAYTLDANQPKNYASNEDRKNDFVSRIKAEQETNKAIRRFSHPLFLNQPHQQIYYGAPGTGKSHEIKKTTDTMPIENVFRTTFHPDSDYSTFVGCYKPTQVKKAVRNVAGDVVKAEGQEVYENTIQYEFVPQAFLKAYKRAYETDEPVVLVIEEINRGNCAQIFGDLFQLLDRKDGVSEYPIDADEDLRKYLIDTLGEDSPAIANGKLCLPANLYIWATMNTSDQSLFPIDSAFKRRWEWKYMKIADMEKGYKIEVNGKHYDWWNFIDKMNDIIGRATSSEDKKLGYFFCKVKEGTTNITAEQFVSKVLFYIYGDALKDYDIKDDAFKKEEKDGKKIYYSFSDFYDAKGNVDKEMVAKLLDTFIGADENTAE